MGNTAIENSQIQLTIETNALFRVELELEVTSRIFKRLV